jgi:hypothetical protein
MSLDTKLNFEKTNASEVKTEPSETTSHIVPPYIDHSRTHIKAEPSETTSQIVPPYIEYSRTHIKGENLEGKERVAGLGPPPLSPSIELLRQ